VTTALPKSTVLRPVFEGIPGVLKRWPAWVLWKLVYETDREKPWTKLPYQLDGTEAKGNNPDTWSSFESVKRAYEKGGWDGIGLELGGVPYLVGVDLDGCRDVATGVISNDAQEIVTQLNSYTELSPSGSGLHILVYGKLPPEGRRKGFVEIYEEGRYFTFSGRRLSGTPPTIERRQAEIEALHRRIFGEASRLGPSTPPGGSASSAAHRLEDQEVIDRAMKAKNGAKFARLWNGDTTEYGGDDSAADQALCNLIAFWTQNPEQIEGIFRRSGLYRPKWEREDYRWRTISKALSQMEFYSPTGSPSNGHRPYAPIPSAIDSEGLKLTDLGNAERFALQHKNKLRYVYAWKSWVAWDGKRWRTDGQAAAERAAHLAVRSMYAEAKSIENPKVRDALVEWARRSESAQHIAAILTLARAQPGIPAEPGDFDRDHWKLNVHNGTLDLRAGELLEHDPKDMITKLAAVKFDRDATCEIWLSFLHRVLAGRQAIIDFLRRSVGYSLTGEVWEHIFFFLFGLGRNGKSTFVETIQAMLGDYSLTAAPDLLMALGKNTQRHPTERADLYGKRFVVCNEPEGGRRLAEGFVKQATGGDRIRARRMHEIRPGCQPAGRS
jgi:putative DNA primase/helicase